jgi:16S rRNA (adenine1518-N6/adenine1519-N6)-dimethyltransferase
MSNKTKLLGQNFLIDEDTAEREIYYCNISNNDVVLEIGAGKGILTKKLVKKAKKVISIEIDQKLYTNLKKEIINKNLILINDDALKIDFNNLPKFNKIVSNLPFQISLPITLKFLDYNFNKAVLIYQKEFAERMISNIEDKNYSRLSVLIYYKTFCKIIENIPKTSFSPIPKVDASIVELIPRKTPPFYLINEIFFFKLTKQLFNHKRKKIQNNLKKYYAIDLKNIPFKNKRIDELSPEDIGNLSNIIFENINI